MSPTIYADFHNADPKPMTEHYTPEESQLLVELAVVLASFAGTQLLEEDFPVIGEPSYLQDKYLRQAQAVLKVVQKNKAALEEPVNKRAYKSAEELAVERMGDIDNPDMWTTVVEADEKIDLEEVLEHLRERGYKIEEPDSMLWRKPLSDLNLKFDYFLADLEDYYED